MLVVEEGEGLLGHGSTGTRQEWTSPEVLGSARSGDGLTCRNQRVWGRPAFCKEPWPREGPCSFCLAARSTATDLNFHWWTARALTEVAVGPGSCPGTTARGQRSFPVPACGAWGLPLLMGRRR